MTLNVNTIANELGTGGPDFVAMPTVAGAPVVESGSNSDGEWTRWADGTQQVRSVGFGLLNTNEATGGGFRSLSTIPWTFPIAFVAAPAFAGVANNASTRWLGAAGGDTTKIDFRQHAWEQSAVDVGSDLQASGRWK